MQLWVSGRNGEAAAPSALQGVVIPQLNFGPVKLHLFQIGNLDWLALALPPQHITAHHMCTAGQTRTQ